MKNLFVHTAKRSINLLRSLRKSYHHLSYSQCGEDMIARIFVNRTRGFYVDVGAFHPKYFSNTHYFYRRKWRGINIDATSTVIEKFKKARPTDINLNCCIGSNDGEEVTFYQFERGELNTICKDGLPEIKKYHGQEPIKQEKLKVRSLASILDEHLPPGQQIDLLNIDAEGVDEEVLRSNNWNKYQPEVIIVEKHASIGDFLASNIYFLLKQKRYELGGFSRHSFVFYRLNAT